MTQTGRLFDTGELDGPLNMAVDELLWDEAGAGIPCLRFYGWSDSPALSIGYFQAWREVVGRAGWESLPLVRRMTGGGTILHDHDLTYSLALPGATAPGTEELYERFHGAVASELRALSIMASVDALPQRTGGPQALCFRRPDPFAVCVAGCKVLGSAQRRRPSAVLMHGSLLLRTSPLLPELPGLDERSGRAPDRQAIADALRRAASQSLGLEWRPAELGAGLRQDAQRRAAERYETDRWNRRR